TSVRSSAGGQAVGQVVRQPGLHDVPLSRRDVVLDAVEGHPAGVRVHHGVGGAGVTIPGLADAAGVGDAPDAVQVEAGCRHRVDHALLLLHDEGEVAMADEAAGRL